MLGMANPPGGPLSGGMEAQQSFVRETLKEAPQPPVQQTEQRSQESQARSPAELEAAAKEKILMQNEQTAEKRRAELAERFGNMPNTSSREREHER